METTFVSFRYSSYWCRVSVPIIFYVPLSFWFVIFDLFFLLFLYAKESASKWQYNLTFPKLKQLGAIKINNHMKYLLAQLCKTL